jgi:hypothetical protein
MRYDEKLLSVHSVIFIWCDSPQWARASSFTRFLHHTQRRTTVGRTPQDEWSDRRRDLYLTTNNTHNRQTSMPRLDSNTQSQHASVCRSTRYITRPLGPAFELPYTIHILPRCNFSPLVNALNKRTECIPSSETVKLNFRSFKIQQIFYVTKEIL